MVCSYLTAWGGNEIDVESRRLKMISSPKGFSYNGETAVAIMILLKIKVLIVAIIFCSFDCDKVIYNFWNNHNFKTTHSIHNSLIINGCKIKILLIDFSAVFDCVFGHFPPLKLQREHKKDKRPEVTTSFVLRDILKAKCRCQVLF